MSRPVADAALPHVTLLKRVHACSEAVDFAKGYPDLQAAWSACDRGDWMLWLLCRSKEHDRKRLVLVACACARLALPHVKAGEDRPRVAIETAERWTRGEAIIEEVKAARNAAYAAAAAYPAYDAAYAAAYDAAYAAYAAAYAAAAAYPAYDAAYAAYAAAAYPAAYAAAYAADAAARTIVRRQEADIIRQHYPNPPEIRS